MNDHVNSKEKFVKRVIYQVCKRIMPAAKNNIWHCVAFVLALHMFNLPFTAYPSLKDNGPTWYGLDPSWEMTINYAWIKKWIWGKEVIYSYGPLGFLSTRIGWGISRLAFLAFDMFVIFNFFFVFRDFLKTPEGKFWRLLILILVSLLLGTHYGSTVSWVLMIFSFYWMGRTYENPAFLSFSILTVLITLAFYIKLNTGFVLYFFMVIHLVNLVLSKKMTISKSAITFSLAIGFLLLCARMFHVAIWDYFRSALEVIKGYNEIMYLNETHYAVKFGINIILATILLLLFRFGLALIKHKDYNRLLFVFMGLAYIFLLRKQSLLRDDIQHLYEFIYSAPLILITGILQREGEKGRKVYVMGTFASILIASGFALDKKPPVVAFERRYASQLTYIKEFNEYYKKPFVFQQDKRYIPQRILHTIGDETVDVFPWDSEYLLENRLNYSFRPMFQSHLAYTPYLQKVNYDFYAKKGPKFIIYDYDSIDRRNPFDDEPSVHFFIAKNYDFADSFISNERWRVLLRRKPSTAALEYKKIKDTEISITDDIEVEGADLIKIDADYNLVGRVLSLLHKPPRIRLVLTSIDGQETKYKTSVQLLKCGVMTDRQINSTRDFVQYVKNRDSLNAIRRIRLNLNPAYFGKRIRIQYLKVS